MTIVDSAERAGPPGREHEREGDSAPSTTATFGIPEEHVSFSARHARFLEIWPRLQSAIAKVSDRRFVPKSKAEKVVFCLGQVAIADFDEILLACGNGYGSAGLKVLRTMFEATVTASYLSRRPREANAFLEYHHVHLRKFFSIAEQVGVDPSTMAEKHLPEIEANYQAVKHSYRQVVCKTCKTDRALQSWTKKDLVTMAREVGIGQLAPFLYFVPTLYIHTTVFRMISRLEETPEGGVSFTSGPERTLADRALVGAHTCLNVLLEEQSRFFKLGLDKRSLRRDFAYAWPRHRDRRKGKRR